MDPIPQTEEEWMFHGILCGDPIATFKLQQLGEEVSPVAVNSGCMAQKGLGSVLGVVVCPELFIGQDAWPCIFIWGSQDAEDEVQLLLHCGAWEEGPACGHLIEDAAHTPHVNLSGVVRGPEQDVRGRYHSVTTSLE